MFLGIITYLDTVKGFKMDYSAISEQRETQSYVFSSVGAILLGFERFWVSLGIITYPRHLNKIIWGIIGGLEKRHTITIAFLDETRYHDYRQQNRAVSNGYWRTQWSHNNGYQDYLLKCFTAHVCMNMIAERTRNVKRLAIFVRLYFLCHKTQ